MLCVGMVAGIGLAAGEGAGLVLQHWLEELSPLLAATAACCQALLPCRQQLAAACQAADVWADETGEATITNIICLPCEESLFGPRLTCDRKQQVPRETLQLQRFILFMLCLLFLTQRV